MTTEPVSQKVNKKARTVFYLLGVAGVILTLYILSLNPAVHPPIPVDEDHRGITDWEQCRTCHRAEGSSPLPPQHPINMEKCMRCHLPAQAAEAPWKQPATPTTPTETETP